MAGVFNVHPAISVATIKLQLTQAVHLVALHGLLRLALANLPTVVGLRVGARPVAVSVAVPARRGAGTPWLPRRPHAINCIP